MDGIATDLIAQASAESIHRINNIIQQQILLNAKLKRTLKTSGLSHCDSLLNQLDAVTVELMQYGQHPDNKPQFRRNAS
jgi:hypothetical protein